MKLYQLMVEHTPEEENLDWTKIEPSVNLLKSPKGTWQHDWHHATLWCQVDIFFWRILWLQEEVKMRLPSLLMWLCWTDSGHVKVIVAALFPPPHRQYWRSYRKLPGHTPHWLEGLPASVVLSAGNRGVCCSGSGGLSEETGEEQEVLLRTEEKRCLLCDELFSSQQVEHIQCEFFSPKDCTNVCIIEALRWEWIMVAGDFDRKLQN